MQLVASVIEVFHNHWIFCNFTSSDQVPTLYTFKINFDICGVSWIYNDYIAPMDKQIIYYLLVLSRAIKPH